MVNTAYGLRTAPRLGYVRARDVRIEAGMEELQIANACFVLSDPRTGDKLGMLVLHVGDA